jgi:hypothetical protein
MLLVIESGVRHEQQARMSHMHQNDHARPFIVIGDVLLHSVASLKPIQVIVQSTTAIPSVNRDSISTLSVLPNLVKRTPITGAVPSDLKNPPNGPVSPSQRAWKTIKSKKILHAHKVGWRLVQELRMKIITLNSSEPEKQTATADSIVEQTYL